MKPEKEPNAQPSTAAEVPAWMLDLDRVGFVRKLFLSRKWYGGDWWFVAVSAVLLVFIIIIGVFPQWFAPYDPRAEVGPSLLAPGQVPSEYVLVSTVERGEITLVDIADKTNNIGLLLAAPPARLSVKS